MSESLKMPHPSGIECDEIARFMSYALGAAFREVWNAGEGSPAESIEHLKKAEYYLLIEQSHRKCLIQRKDLVRPFAPVDLIKDMEKITCFEYGEKGLVFESIFHAHCQPTKWVPLTNAIVHIHAMIEEFENVASIPYTKP